MSTAIRYFTKFGHSAQMAAVAGQVVGVQAFDISDPLAEPVDTLYLGCGVFLGKISKEMTAFIKSLTPDKVRRVVCFGSCAIIKSPVPQMRALLEAQGIQVDDRSFTCKGSMGPLHSGHPNRQDLENLKQFIQTTL